MYYAISKFYCKKQVFHNELNLTIETELYIQDLKKTDDMALIFNFTRVITKIQKFSKKKSYVYFFNHS